MLLDLLGICFGLGVVDIMSADPTTFSRLKQLEEMTKEQLIELITEDLDKYIEFLENEDYKDE